jgi:hypothetical protein
MSTPFSSVYAVFMRKVTDYSFLKLSQNDLEDILQGYISSACVNFKKCRSGLTRDDVTNTFDATLTEEELEILGTLMVVEWLNPQIYNTLLMKQHLNDKDFKIYSQAQHLEQLTKLRDDKKEEADGLIMAYSFDDPTELEKLR